MSVTGFNVNHFVKDSDVEKPHEIIDVSTAENKPSRGRPKKKTENNAIAVQAPAVPETSMSYLQQNIPYATAYQETNMQLDESIAQLNALGAELVSELQVVRGSKTLRNKYDLINEMTSTTTNIINSKISAIKEKNKTTNDVMRLELERLKTLKTQANEKDDNTRMADLYDAFINTPVGVGRAALGPATQDMIFPGQQFEHISIGGDQAAWEQSLDPAQNRMVLEAKGVIDTVVVYDEATGNRWFDVIDKATGQPVPNVEKPDSTYIYDLDINVRGNFAKDSNRNTTYPLIVINSSNQIDDSMSKY